MYYCSWYVDRIAEFDEAGDSFPQVPLINNTELKTIDQLAEKKGH